MRTWTDQQLEILKETFPAGDLKELSEILNKTKGAIKTKARLLGIYRTINVKKNWTEKEIETMKACYADIPTSTLANWFGRSHKSVYMQAKLMGLKKSSAFLSSEASGRRNRENYNSSGKANQFKKGHTPFNKGKKQTEYMSPVAIAQCQKTQFKKGQLPVNTYKEESEIISLRKDNKGNKYQHIKIAHGNWVLLHRHVWEKHHGPIPKGMIVVFKNGNSMDCQIENLECISLADNMKRNSFVNLPEDVISLVHAKASLTRALNQSKKIIYDTNPTTTTNATRPS